MKIAKSFALNSVIFDQIGEEFTKPPYMTESTFLNLAVKKYIIEVTPEDFEDPEDFEVMNEVRDLSQGVGIAEKNSSVSVANVGSVYPDRQ